MISINNFDGQIIDTGETNVYKEEEIVEIKIPKKSTPDDTITDIISLLSKLNKSETIVFKYLFNKTCMNFAPNHLNEINTIVRLDYNLFDDMKANYNISERNTRSAVESLCKKRLMFKPIDGKGRRILGCVSISNAILCTNITKGTAGAIIIKY